MIYIKHKSDLILGGASDINLLSFSIGLNLPMDPMAICVYQHHFNGCHVIKRARRKDSPLQSQNNFGNTKGNVLLMMPVNKRYCLKGKSISDGSALDPMGLKSIDT